MKMTINKDYICTDRNAKPLSEASVYEKNSNNLFNGDIWTLVDFHKGNQNASNESLHCGYFVNKRMKVTNCFFLDSFSEIEK